MRKEIAIVAGLKDWGDTRESWLARVPAKVPTVSFRTVKSLWYGEIRNENHWAAREIKRAAQLIEAQKEAADIARQFEKLAVGLVVTDQDFHQPTIAALLGALRQLRGSNSSGD